LKVTDTKKIQSDLEKQFTEGLQTNLMRSHHVGLGFASSGASASYAPKPAQAPKNTHIKFDEEEEDPSAKKSDDPKKSKINKLSFVKSSS
jgi:hypothetical protein